MSTYSEFANSLASIIQSGANAQAEVQRQRGQIWGNALSNIGQIVADIPKERAQQQELQLRAQAQGLEAQKQKVQLDALQRAQAGEQQANQVIAGLPRNPDDTFDTGALMQKLAQGNVPLQQQEQLTKSIDSVNGVISSWNKQKDEHRAELANALLSMGPVTADSVHLGIAAAKTVGLATDQDEQELTKALASGADPEKLLKLVRSHGSKYSAAPSFESLPANSAGVVNKATGEITQTGIMPRIANETELLVAANDPNSPVHEQAVAALAAKQKAAPESKVGSFEDYVTRTYGANPTSAQVLAARKAYGQADDRVRVTVPPAEKLVKVEHKDPETGKTVIEWLPQSQLKGQKFEKGSGATVENRLASAEAVTQTGQDIISKLGDPAYAKTVGPVMGRYNSIRDWIGNPPPELSELAGMIESYSLANMGVHGMRSAQGAAMIRQLMESKQTPASIIAAIKGLNSFSQHYMQNEGRPSAAPTTTGKKVGRFEIVSEE